MKTLVRLFLSLVIASSAMGQTTCASKSFINPIVDANNNPLGLGDSAEHDAGGHGVLGGDLATNTPGIQNQCTYSGTPPSSGYCDSQCDVATIPGFTGNPSGVLSPLESGSLTTLLDHHEVSVFWLPGHNFVGNPQQGVSCTGAMGYAVGSCLVKGCGISIAGISIGVDSSGKPNATVNLSGTSNAPLSKQGLPLPLTCAPWNPTGGGGGGSCTPNPNNPFQIAPIADLGVKQTDPGDPPPPCTVSPIIIDIEGEGFHLTSAAQGVIFDIRGDGHPIQMAWTAPGFQNAFLALPGSDGLVHNGKELFGDFTQQPKSSHPNGFLALAEYDKPENGGNGDGIIDEQDAVFAKLRLWIDENHDGISQPGEIHTLPELGIRSLALSYFESRKTDEFGNQFRYKARVNPRREHRDSRDETESGEPGRWIYDVFFVTR